MELTQKYEWVKWLLFVSVCKLFVRITSRVCNRRYQSLCLPVFYSFLKLVCVCGHRSWQRVPTFYESFVTGVRVSICNRCCRQLRSWNALVLFSIYIITLNKSNKVSWNNLKKIFVLYSWVFHCFLYLFRVYIVFSFTVVF